MQKASTRTRPTTQLREDGAIRCRRRKLIINGASKPYVSLRGTAYCIRRAKRVGGELPRRPRICAGAEYINRAASNNITWADPGVAYGEVIDDVDRGGEGERWAVLHAFADWVGDYVRRRSDSMPYQLLAMRCHSVDGDPFPPPIPRRLGGPKWRRFWGGTCEIHMDNARVHLYSADYSPSKKTHTRGSLLKEAITLMEEGANTRITR